MKRQIPATLLLVIAMLACITPGTSEPPVVFPTHDPNAIQTYIVQTAELAYTQTAAALPVSTPTPDWTPTPVSESDILDAHGIPMRRIPAGFFMMGNDAGNEDEKPVHAVDLPEYYIDKYEVTNKLYRACVDAGVCVSQIFGGKREPGRHDSESYTRPNYYGNPEFDNHPVVYVTMGDARAYCEWRGVRLPTEAEWEKAARGEDQRMYPWGEGLDCSRANYGRQSNTATGECAGEKDTVAVGSYPTDVSPYGVYDMAGNVTEWVNDWYSEIYYRVSPFSNPQGPPNGDAIIRGGSWWDSSQEFSLTRRIGYSAGGAKPMVGFRCATSKP